MKRYFCFCILKEISTHVKFLEVSYIESGDSVLALFSLKLDMIIDILMSCRYKVATVVRKQVLLCRILEEPYDVMESKMAVSRSFKSVKGGNRSKFLTSYKILRY